MSSVAPNDLEFVLRLSTILLLGAGLAISGYHRRNADRRGGGMKSLEGQGLLRMVRLLGLIIVLPLLLWFVAPETARWAQWGAPTWLRLAGLGMQVVALPCLIWVLRTIGDNISPTQATREGHQLVTHGPYRYIRHPLYTFGTLYWAGMAFASALWWLAVGILPLWGMLLWRTPREEANLVAAFGPAYREYQAHTGRYLPRLGRGGRSLAG